MSDRKSPRFLPGTTYKTRGKHPRLCTIKDVHLTYNLAGDLVRVRYLAAHEFMGQLVTDRDVSETTVAMGVIKAVTMASEENIAT